MFKTSSSPTFATRYESGLVAVGRATGKWSAISGAVGIEVALLDVLAGRSTVIATFSLVGGPGDANGVGATIWISDRGLGAFVLLFVVVGVDGSMMTGFVGVGTATGVTSTAGVGVEAATATGFGAVAMPTAPSPISTNGAQ